MKVEVLEAGRDDYQRISALFELYTYDFSEILPLDVGEDGRFGLPPIDIYRTDPHCHAFVFRVDEKLAGFALVQQKSRLSGDPSVFDMAEFFVMRRYRRRGIGETAARWLFDRFSGRWEVREKADHQSAIAFWRRVIGRSYRFEEAEIDDERWHGPVQCFDTG